MMSSSFKDVQIPNMAMPVVEGALAKVDHDYSTGYPDYDGGVNGGRSYHNGYHSRAVVTDFDQLASALGIDAIERVVGLTASAAHDIEQDIGPSLNEEASAQWLSKRLRDDLGLDDAYVQMGEWAILGTVPIFENGQMVDQTANTNTYRSKRHELIAKMVASADLGRLYAPDGPYLAHMLLKEINGCTPHEPIEFEKVLGFQQGQVPFLEQYRFPLSEAAGVLAVRKAEVVTYAGNLVDSIEQGDVTTWDELISRDLEFMRELA